MTGRGGELTQTPRYQGAESSGATPQRIVTALGEIERRAAAVGGAPGSGTDDSTERSTYDVLVATGVKVLAVPLLTDVAAIALGQTGPALLALVVIAALPTA